MSFCSHDESAYGLITGLKAHGLQVRRDIAIAGFDDLSFSAVMDPPLTTVRLPRQEMAEQAVRKLKALDRGWGRKQHHRPGTPAHHPREQRKPATIAFAIA